MGDGVELVVDCRCSVGEGPAWDARDGALLWVDIIGGDVFRHVPASGETTRMRLDRDVSAVLPRASGGYLLTTPDGVMAVDRFEQGAPLELVRAVEPELPDNRINDAKCDPRGRLWCGTLASGWKPHAGSLYCLDANLELHRAASGSTISNGLGWSPDGTRFYFADSAPRTLDVFDFDLESGRASNRRRFVELAEGSGSPDGLAVDADGFIWLAVWGSGTVHRYAPDGTLERVVPIPVRDVASCCFGGPDLEDLYVTTAWRELDEEQHAANPLAGGLFRLRPGVRGLPTVPFAG
jgi:sugar lactone lactonase YvrE